MNTDFRYTLLENGLDFVRSCLEHLKAAQEAKENNGQKRHLKYALIHLCSGIELVLKERLRQEDWRLVFADQDKATEEAYESGEFFSVDFKALQSRLEDDCGIDLTPEQKADLKTFRSRRNKVEHFNVVDTLLAMQSSTAKMVSFLVDFIDQNFEVENFEEEELELLTEIRSNLSSCAAVVQERVTLIEPEVKQLYSVIRCPSCLQIAMSADGGKVRCLFCFSGPDPSDAADEYVTNVLGYPSSFEVEKDGGDWPVRTCPECGDETFVTEVPDSSGNFYCFNCGYENSPEQMERCNDCGEYYDHDGEPGCHICSDCFNARVSRDD
jgi:ribosomal protein S27AE